MFRTRADQEAAIHAAHYETEKRKAIDGVYQKFPLMIRCMANEQEILDIIRHFAGPSVVPSAELFFSALDENPNALKSLAQQPEAKTRAQLTEEILSLLAVKGKGHDAFTLKQEEKRLALLSIPALRARLADLKCKAKMASTDVAALKQFVANASRDQRRFPGFPDLPKTVWDGTKTVPVDAAFFKALDAFDLKRYVRLYSAKQLNNRLAGRS